jgi:RND superfamily putative drug exporter
VLGHRVNRLRVVPRRILRADESDVWRRVATTIMRAPALFLVLGTALLLLLAAPVRELTMGASPIDTLPGDGPAVRGAKLLDAAFGGGATVPLRVLVDRPAAALGDLPARLGEAPGVVGARLAGSASGSTLIDVVGSGGVGSDAASDLVAELRERTLPAALPPGAVALVGGGPAVFADFEDAIYGNFVWLVAGVIAITYVILFRAFRSVFLPLKAVLMNLLSVGGSYGLLVLVFQLGVGADLLGFERTDQVAVWIPVFLFAFLFGLSMDYEVFLLARMREEYDRLVGQPDANARAVATGLAKTGEDHHVRGADHGPGLRGPGHEPLDRDAAARLRPRDGRAARRDADPDAGRPEPDGADGPLELVAPRRAAAARGARPAARDGRRAGLISRPRRIRDPPRASRREAWRRPRRGRTSIEGRPDTDA